MFDPYIEIIYIDRFYEIMLCYMLVSTWSHIIPCLIVLSCIITWKIWLILYFISSKKYSIFLYNMLSLFDFMHAVPWQAGGGSFKE